MITKESNRENLIKAIKRTNLTPAEKKDYIKNIDTVNFNNRFYATAQEILDYGLYWSESPQGFKYWSKLNRALLALPTKQKYFMTGIVENDFGDLHPQINFSQIPKIIEAVNSPQMYGERFYDFYFGRDLFVFSSGKVKIGCQEVSGKEFIKVASKYYKKWQKKQEAAQ